ncbi:hypothetical protein L218DRAFT_921913 [Marasmius fiardii PR-910]|nr:hypothetical protein L218DRAFT_921913 [Marasmius fiardii PR-910]
MFYSQLCLSTAIFVLSAVASPSQPASVRHHRRTSPDNIVKLDSAENYCMIMPRDPYTNIGDSERPGGMVTYCSKAAKYDDSQGDIPDGFWTKSEFLIGSNKSGKRFAQITGCIDPSVLDRLNTVDEGGQYDSSGGKKAQGNPKDSVCIGYNHYIELVEPAGRRACIKCCDDPNDCPLKMDALGCPTVIPGNYFDCA